MDFADVVRIRFSSEAVEQLTFTGPLLAEPAKGWLLTALALTTAVAYAAVVTEYLPYMVVSSSLSVVAVLLLLTSHELPTLVRPGPVVVMAVTLAFLGAFTFASISGIGLIAPALRRLRAVVGARAVHAAHAFEVVEEGIIDVLHNHPRRWAAVVAIELAAEMMLVLEIWIIIGALGFSRAWTSALTIEGGIKFVGTAFLFIPDQFGASEGVYSLLAGTLGFTAAVGLGVARVRCLRSVVIATAGVLVFARS